MPSKEQLKQIEALSNGNALLLSLFPVIAKEYGTWEALDYEEMKRRVEEDSSFGLLFYMTNRVLSHFEQKDKLWKVVIPRVLTQKLEHVLFEKSGMMKRLIEVGLATAGQGFNSNFYYLHDDVHRAIENYFQKNFKGNHSSWHDKEEVALFHRELVVFYDNNTINKVNSEFEKCYHNIMLKKDFERDFEISRKEFSNYILGDIFRNFKDKKSRCQSIDGLEKEAILELIKEYKDTIKEMKEE